MRRYSIIVFVTILLSVTLISAFNFRTATAVTSPAPFYYGVWLPFWKAQSGAQDVSINLDKVDEVSPFSYEVGSTGKLIDDAKINNGSWSGWFSAARDLHVKIIPTIAWFDGDVMYNLLSNTTKRIGHEDAITALAKAQNFDGIDIDYEGKIAKVKPYFSLFIQGLATRLHAQKKTLTCTVEPRTPPADAFVVPPSPVPYSTDYAVLNTYCDEIRVMAYDQGTVDLKLDAQKGSTTLYAPVADTAWVTKVLQETLKYVNPKKIMLGVPTYGYEYEVSWANGVTTYRRVRSFTFQEAMDRADLVGLTPLRNNAGELGFAYPTSTFVSVSATLTSFVSSTRPQALASLSSNATNTLFTSFPDAKSALEKITLAKKYGLRGVIFFKADGEFDPALWDTMK